MKKIWIPTLLTISLTPMVSIVSCKKPDKPEPEITPTGINLDVSELNLEIGQSSTLTATVEPEGASQDVEWSVDPDDIDIVSVNNGTVKALNAGDATIIAKPKGYDIPATCSVHVTQPEIPPTTITISPPTKELEIGESCVLIVDVVPSEAYKGIIWSTSDPSVVSLSSCYDEGCKATAKGNGEATIIAKSKNYNVKGECKIKVGHEPKPVYPQEVTLNETKLVLAQEETFQLAASVLPEGASQVVVWSIESDPSEPVVATIDQTGLVTAKNPGKAIATATASGFPGVFASCAITVKRPPSPAPEGDYLSITSDIESTVQVHVGGGWISEENLPNIQYWDGNEWQEVEFTGSGQSWSFETEADTENNYTVFLRGDNPEGLCHGSDGSDIGVRIACPDANSDASWVVGGSVMALIDNGVEAQDPVIPEDSDGCFAALFEGNDNIIEVEQDLLPATTLQKNCYDRLFSSCGGLINVPDLPAAIVPKGAYYRMFELCDSLEDILEELPATKIANAGCWFMFLGCTSLTTTCALTATSLANGSYNSMFMDCPNLQTIKKITVGDLGTAENVFDKMFSINEGIEQPDYAFYETGSDDNIALDLTNCVSLHDNFTDMFAGRIGIQQPEIGKKYCFTNVES